MTLRKRNAMNSHPETLLAAVRYFADLDVCDQYMWKIKWPGGKIGRVKMTWKVYRESSSYWDVGELVGEVPPGFAAHVKPGEIAYCPVCRVHKHADGAAYLRAILGLGELLAAAEELLGLMDEVPLDPNMSPSMADAQTDRCFARFEFDRLRAAIAAVNPPEEDQDPTGDPALQAAIAEIMRQEDTDLLHSEIALVTGLEFCDENCSCRSNCQLWYTNMGTPPEWQDANGWTTEDVVRAIKERRQGA
jgi:hypothetical protein